MIHKIKSLYDNGNGSSVRAIARQLGISRNTVRKHLELDTQAIAERRAEAAQAHSKRLDPYRDYLIHLFQTYPRLSAVKALRKLKEKVNGVEVAERSMRRYVSALKKTIATKQKRYYEPVLDMVPGVQCQVDGGELRDVMIGGVATVVYFVVFVLSFSRLMFVGLSRKPLDTEGFIHLHDAAFRYFGGTVEECVYDQTKLVVLNETFRELELNPRFHEYATRAGFTIRACEGYDPESKGRVEAGVKYVKNNALYAETFADWTALESHLAEWLEATSNARTHGTTQQQPRALFEAEERARLRPYLQPDLTLFSAPVSGLETRKADKTGLISWQANKYSVPEHWQNANVGVRVQGRKLLIHDLENREEIARHAVCEGKGRIIKDPSHYRDREQQIADYERAIGELIGASEGGRLCALLKATSPTIYKDQLLAAKRLLRAHGPLQPAFLERLLDRAQLTATGLRDLLDTDKPPAPVPSPPVSSALSRYAGVTAGTQGGDAP